MLWALALVLVKFPNGIASQLLEVKLTVRRNQKPRRRFQPQAAVSERIWKTQRRRFLWQL